MRLQLPDPPEVTSFTVVLANGMTVTIYDAGHGFGTAAESGQPMIEVRQASRDLLNGAEAPEDTPRYDMGGRYEFALPDASEIGRRCDQRDTDPGSLPAEGTATIDVIHWHG
jgi:hypothetical protein